MRLLALPFAVSCLLAGAVVEALQETPTALGDVDIDELVRETQRSVRGDDAIGLVWWITTEFLEMSARQYSSASDDVISAEFAPMREYLIFAVVIGEITLMGPQWIPHARLRDMTILKDADGNVYEPLEDVPSGIQTLPAMLKTVLAQMLGQLGENIEILFFPARNADGELIADPKERGQFSIVLSELPGSGESTYEWRLPLSSLFPPILCPVGNERLQRNWNYCPWHGVPLRDDVPRDPRPGSWNVEEKASHTALAAGSPGARRLTAAGD